MLHVDPFCLKFNGSSRRRVEEEEDTLAFPEVKDIIPHVTSSLSEGQWTNLNTT